MSFFIDKVIRDDTRIENAAAVVAGIQGSGKYSVTYRGRTYTAISAVGEVYIGTTVIISESSTGQIRIMGAGKLSNVGSTREVFIDG